MSVPAAVSTAVTSQPAAESRKKSKPRKRWLFGPVKFLLAMVFCQTPIGALLILGWTFRLIQRAALKQWWRLARVRGSGPITFSEFIAMDSRWIEHVSWPNWVVSQNFSRALQALSGLPLGRRLRTFVKLLVASLWQNLKLGTQGILNVWLFTLPGCLLMFFGWYDGWNNSFNKGYEQAVVGPGISLLGIALLIGALFYVPMAQARQAVTGEWRRFYDFRLVWTLARRMWFGCLGLAVLYAALMLPIMVLGFLPMFFPQLPGAAAEVSPGQAVAGLKTYFFWCAALVFPAFVSLRWIAARLYAHALLRALQAGTITEEALSELEWHAFHRLNLFEVVTTAPRHRLIRLAAWTGSRVARILATLLAVLVGFVLVGQMYVSSFMNYRHAFSWLNHPLIQLPWFRHLPAYAQNPWAEVFAAVVIVGLAFGINRVFRCRTCDPREHGIEQPAHR